MDPNRDNPIIRFATFWWGIDTFMIFALLFAVIWFFHHNPAVSLEDVVAKARYETKARIQQEQATSLPSEAVDAAIPVVARALAAAKPAAVEKPDQVAPDTPTARRLAAETPATPPPAAPEPPKP